MINASGFIRAIIAALIVTWCGARVYASEIAFNEKWAAAYWTAKQSKISNVEIRPGLTPRELIRETAVQLRMNGFPVSIIVGPSLSKSKKKLPKVSLRNCSAHDALSTVAAICNSTLVYERFGIVLGTGRKDLALAQIALKGGNFNPSDRQHSISKFGPARQLAVSPDGRCILILADPELVDNIVGVLQTIGIIENHSTKVVQWPLSQPVEAVDAK